MLFTKPMANLILDGLKWQTRRFALKRPAVPGSLHYAQRKLYDKDSRFARLKILKTWEWNGLYITPEDATAEGFQPIPPHVQGQENTARFLNYYRMLNKKASKAHLRKHWAIEFEVVETYCARAEVVCGCGDHYRTYFNDPLCWICMADENPKESAP